MTLTSSDAHEIQVYLRCKGFTIKSTAALLGLDRSTISKKLSGAQEITPLDLFEIAEKIGEQRHSLPGARR